MKRCSSAPCLADESTEVKRTKTTEEQKEPNAKEYLQLALARVLELQREIKDGSYVVNAAEDASDRDDYGSDDDLTKEVVSKVFENLPGTTSSVKRVIANLTKGRPAELDLIRTKRIQLLGYETCRRTAVDFMKGVVREGRPSLDSSDFRYGTYSKNEPRMAHRRSGLLENHERRWNVATRDHEVQDRMLRSLDLHLAVKQRDYTVKLMRS